MENDEIDCLINELHKTKQTLDNTDYINKKLNDLSILCFIQNVQSVANKLFYVSIKICDNSTELQTLDINYSSLKPAYWYYVVQIFVSQLFQAKLIDNNWIASIGIKTQNQCIYKTICLKNVVPSDCISFVVPFPKREDTDVDVVDAVVETRFYLPDCAKFWANFDVARIETDISYFLTPLYEHKLLKTEQCNDLHEISKMYTDCIKLKDSQKRFEYRFNCKMSLRHFFEVILKNNIHKLNINHVQMLNSNEETCNIQLFVNNTSAIISFDAKNKVLKINGCVDVLNRFKKFLIKNVKKETHVLIDPSLVVRLQNLRMQLNIENNESYINIENIKMLYEEYKNIVGELPV